MDNIILSALGSLPVAEMSRAEWIMVGMALKEEGCPCSVWDEWSRKDTRYHPGECEKKWEGFRGSDKLVKAGTIVKMAKDRGWKSPMDRDGAIRWDDAIQYDGDDSAGMAPPAVWDPVEQLKTYLRILFRPEEIVGYVTSDVWQDEDGDWHPSKGVYYKTVAEILKSLDKYPNDLGATIGDWRQAAGAWIRFNPLDGKGVKNENVTRFTYALVESDTLSIPEQDALFRKLELPIAVMVNSGGKSLHAIVRVDAEDIDEYRKRVDFLYDFLEKNGVTIDKQNRNPSRLSRLPGVTRNGKRQYIVATNIGRKSWADWMDFVEGVNDELPDMESLSIYKDNPPVLPEELIQGILRRGHKMLISGSSKAGKSFLLMELCIAIAEGTKWLGFSCRQGRVLYVNLEIDPASCIDRFLKIYEALGLPMDHTDSIVLWNLRGHAVPLDQLVPKLIRRVRDQHFDAIVIDPIYKVITGDENSASDMGAFCNQFDKICNTTGCSTIYCHHHSKGAQGAKKAMDRASGSGVFARDPDAQLDMIELELSEDIKNNVRDGNATAWRLESSLREFPNIKPVNFWFEYPIHRLDDKDALEDMPAQGSMAAGKLKNPRSKSSDEADDEFRMAYEACNLGGDVTVQDMMKYLGVTDKTVYARIKKMDGEFVLKKGKIIHLEDRSQSA